jgi:hypothetical protein
VVKRVRDEIDMAVSISVSAVYGQHPAPQKAAHFSG